MEWHYGKKIMYVVIDHDYLVRPGLTLLLLPSVAFTVSPCLLLTHSKTTYDPPLLLQPNRKVATICESSNE